MKAWLLIKKIGCMYIHLLYTPINKLRFKFNGVHYGCGLKVRGNIYIFRHYNTSSVNIGDHVSINSAGWANPIGCGNKTYLQLFRNGKITIGDYCGISNAALTSASGITLGQQVMIGSGCRIYDTDFHPIKYEHRTQEGNQEEFTATEPIVIEDGAFIGAGSFILKGVHIGKHSIIGANSVVTKSIPDNEIWGGNPAMFIKKIES